MDYQGLSELMFPQITKTIADYEQIYPQRDLPEGARVTRLAPSPTGFIHLGNLYGALADERLAHQSGGVFFLRIEDTDDKREVEGAVETLITSLDYFGIHFDEGATVDGEVGAYGPYQQSVRKEVYQTVAKALVAKGLAYPCFCSEETLAASRAAQEAQKANIGYYGTWAVCRHLSLEEAAAKLAAGEKYVVRLRSTYRGETILVEDAIRGALSLPANQQDIVLLKQNGIPTYHFAHVVDDHFMRTTHVVRGEEWLSTLPAHVEMFQALEWPLPVYCHTAHLMKQDGAARRKLSKRKDPELGLDYYRGLGYHPQAVREYLMTILNSNYEEWRLAHPHTPSTEFGVTMEKMGKSGALFDLDKLNDIAKDVMAEMSAADIYGFLLEWAKEYKPEAYQELSEEQQMVEGLLDIGRSGDKPRKDLIYAKQIFAFIAYCFDDHYVREDDYSEHLSAEDIKTILEAYKAHYIFADDDEVWFGKMKDMAAGMGYAAKPKDYKKNPDQYKGHIGDVMGVIRLAVVGRTNSPDLWSIQQVMGYGRVMKRIDSALAALEA